jgi:hypothetical protein
MKIIGFGFETESKQDSQFPNKGLSLANHASYTSFLIYEQTSAELAQAYTKSRVPDWDSLSHENASATWFWWNTSPGKEL